MLNFFKVRINHGSQAIKDIKKATVNDMHRGFPVVDEAFCLEKCEDCINCCPTGAISKSPLSLDIGKCVFCGECERLCKNKAIQFTNYHKISTTDRQNLIINKKLSYDDFNNNSIKIRKDITKIFKRSLKIRQVSCGGCNACEMELNACSNVNFDMGRFGIDIVASPRHSDCILITGPITENMADALEDTYQCSPNPKIVILAGSCAISGGMFAKSNAINREFLAKYKIDLYIPGCPVHPLTVINGILGLLGR